MQVLRFYGTCDYPPIAAGAPPERRSYVLHYFLADDTVEVLEVMERNSGRDPFAKLLSRQPLPKAVPPVGGRPAGQLTRNRTHVPCVSPTDLVLGQARERPLAVGPEWDRSGTLSPLACARSR